MLPYLTWSYSTLSLLNLDKVQNHFHGLVVVDLFSSLQYLFQRQNVASLTLLSWSAFRRAQFLAPPVQNFTVKIRLPASISCESPSFRLMHSISKKKDIALRKRLPNNRYLWVMNNFQPYISLPLPASSYSIAIFMGDVQMWDIL